MESFAQRLKKALTEAKMSQKELATAAGITPAAVSSYLSGIYLPRKKTLARMAEVLGVDTEYLTGTSPFVKPLEGGSVRKVQLPVLDIKVE